MTPKDEVPPAQASSITDAAATGARAQALEMRGRLPQHRNNSVTSFDSLATSFSSTASTSSLDNYPLKSPALRADSYTDSVNAARRGSAMSGEAYPHQSSGHRAHSRQRTGSHSRDPYPGVWRRTKRWSREAAKVLAIVDEFARSPEGRAACAAALRNCPYQLSASLPGAACENGGELAPMDGSKPVPASLNIGPVSSLRTLLLAISAIDFQRLVLEMDAFKRYTRAWERREGHSRRVLTHGDTQYGNLLIRKEMNPDRPVASGMPRIRAAEDAASPLGGAAQPRSRSRSRKNLVPHERLVVIDMEYLNHGPRAYDIANMFVEMGADYDHPTDSWNMTANGPYPSTEMRRRWLRAYAEQGRLMRMRGKTPKLPSATTLGR
ncbi:Choline kinase [Ceraceosorus bombacis]|uniref:Choline kinase n=1 Tax=Ceraceosorus bombacis TaxID=401625 RepID=A0A0P1BQV5_9BASI|nr:Choline kinase [Ceraceosorus bombacis]